MAPPGFSCPRCGRTRVAGPTCVYCGVIFDKAQPRVLPAPVEAPQPRSGGGGLLFLFGLTAVAAVGWSSWKAQQPAPVEAPIAAAPAPTLARPTGRSGEESMPHPDAAARALTLPTRSGELSALLPPGYALHPRSRKLKVSDAGAETVTLIEARSRGPQEEPRLLSLGHAESLDPTDVNRQAYLELHLRAAVADIDGVVMRQERARMGERFGLIARVRGADKSGEAIFASVQVAPVGYGELAILVVAGRDEAAWEGVAARNFFASLDHRSAEGTVALTPEGGAPPTEAAPVAPTAIDVPTCPQDPLAAEANEQRLRELPRLVAATRGCLTLVEVWASWCPTCRAVAPEVDRIARTYQSRGLRVLSVPTDDDRLALISALRPRPPAGDVLLFAAPAKGELGAAISGVGGTYGDAIPYFLLLDRDGRAIEQWTGAEGLDGLDERLQARL